MKPTELFNQINFHDSIVNEIFFGRNELILKLEFCNWKQSGYSEVEPELLEGILTFINVQEHMTRPPVFLLENNEILEANAILYNEMLEQIKIVITGEDDVIVINLKAQEVTWVTAS
ncbi:hypothetical protein GCM10010912_69560 [Paenibacillus albidus]|uniref:Uncharacterized protein n=1 Tax=Paenibacillus albidus TaxID=2041023 RepID=A0A917FZH7_9BACL|nr:hypothetical protein [Paenibacillus albidus]GGG15230.1 hypothetical protein GCM10010912_69560 [Paenibacillus albidus]